MKYVVPVVVGLAVGVGLGYKDQVFTLKGLLIANVVAGIAGLAVFYLYEMARVFQNKQKK